MISAFLVAMVAVVLAEMGDKTQLLAMAFASRFRWQIVLWAVFVATLANHLMAVAAGNVVTHLLPIAWIKLAAGASFIAFALWTIRGDELAGREQGRGRSPFWTVAIAFFLAEMGDKTQLMTIALGAEQAVKVAGTGWIVKAQQVVPTWMGTTCGMLIADSIGIIVGIVLHRHIPDRLVKWVAACCFAGFGLLGLHDASDELLPIGASWHHPILVVAVPVTIISMWLVARLTRRH
jgi:putative Ca2+/H+ antiporter (TMEM165/GDT1 family)